MLHKAHPYDGINIEHISNIPENILNSHAYIVPNNAKRLWIDSTNYNYKAPRSRHGPPQLSPIASYPSKNDLANYNRGQKRLLAHSDLGTMRQEIERSERLNYENEAHKYPRKRFKSEQEFNNMSECEDMLLNNGRIMSKEHLNQRIVKIEGEICSLETNIGKLKMVQDELYKGRKNVEEVDHSIPFLNFEPRPLPIARHIYEENNVKANQSHGSLLKNCKLHDISSALYSQPSDTQVFKDNQEKFTAFKKHLVTFLSKRRQAENIRIRYLSERYNQLQQQWAKKMEKKENSALRKEKDVKYRECFERVFPELKKIKEEKDKIQRFAAAQSTRPVYARSDVFLDEIVNGLREQEMKEQRMRSLSVVPPLLLDSRRRSMRFINESRLLRVEDVGVSSVSRLRDWVPGDQDTFVEKFGQYPKKFNIIASFFENKTVQDCVWFYYITKKDANYKQIVRRFLKEQKKKRSAPELSNNYRTASPTININGNECGENFEIKDVPFKIGELNTDYAKISDIKDTEEVKVLKEDVFEDKSLIKSSDEIKPKDEKKILENGDISEKIEIKEEIKSEKNHSDTESTYNLSKIKEKPEALNGDMYNSKNQVASPVTDQDKISNNIHKLINNANLKEGGYIISSLEDVSDTDSVDTDTADEGDNDSPSRRNKMHTAKIQSMSVSVTLPTSSNISTTSAPKKTIIRDLIHAIIEGNLQNDARMTPDNQNKNTKMTEDWQLIAPRKSPAYSDSTHNSEASTIKIMSNYKNSPSPGHHHRISHPPIISTPYNSVPTPSPNMMMHSKMYHHQQQQQISDDPLNQLATVALQIGPIVCHNDSKKIVPPIACRGSITQGTSGNVNKSQMHSLKQHFPSIDHIDQHYKMMTATPPMKQVENTDNLRHDFKTALQMRGVNIPLVMDKSEMRNSRFDHSVHHQQAASGINKSEYNEDNRDSLRIQSSFKKTMLDSIPKSSGNIACNTDTPKPHITAANLIEAIIAMQINQGDGTNKEIMPMIHQLQPKSMNGIDMKPDISLGSNHSILQRIDASVSKRVLKLNDQVHTNGILYPQGNHQLQSIDSKIHEFLPDRSYMSAGERTYLTAGERNFMPTVTTHSDRVYIPAATDRCYITSATEYKYKTASDRINAIIEQGISQPKTASDRINAIIEQGLSHSQPPPKFNISDQNFRHMPPQLRASYNLGRNENVAEAIENNYRGLPPMLHYIHNNVSHTSAYQLETYRPMNAYASNTKISNSPRDELHNVQFPAMDLVEPKKYITIPKMLNHEELSVSPNNRLTASDRINAIIEEGLQVNQHQEYKNQQMLHRHRIDVEDNIPNNTAANLKKSSDNIQIISFSRENISKPFVTLADSTPVKREGVLESVDSLPRLASLEKNCSTEEGQRELKMDNLLKEEPVVSKTFSWKSKMMRQHVETLHEQPDELKVSNTHAIQDILSKEHEVTNFYSVETVVETTDSNNLIALTANNNLHISAPGINGNAQRSIHVYGGRLTNVDEKISEEVVKEKPDNLNSEQVTDVISNPPVLVAFAKNDDMETSSTTVSVSASISLESMTSTCTFVSETVGVSAAERQVRQRSSSADSSGSSNNNLRIDLNN